MNWSDQKKWQMDLVGKAIMAIVVSIAAVSSAILVDQRFQTKLIEKNHQLQKELDEQRFRANRIETQARSLETSAAEFLETAYLYADALESAFKDTYYRHQHYHGDSKGKNQIRYENELDPKLNATIYKLSLFCERSSKVISELGNTRKEAFDVYNKIENKPTDAKRDQTWVDAKKDIEIFSNQIRTLANKIFSYTIECLDDLAKEK